ncbi:MAG: hypothetical protein ACO3F9_02450 [Burkholderiales bacterium]
MPNNAALLQLLDRWIDTAGRCMTAPMSMPVCQPFWEYVMYASAAVAAVLLLWAGWKTADYLLLHLAERREQRERGRVADQETMRKHVWNDDRLITDEVTDPHLAEKIRQELEQRRLQNMHNTRFGAR